jgi:hypothetical protein
MEINHSSILYENCRFEEKLFEFRVKKGMIRINENRSDV